MCMTGKRVVILEDTASIALLLAATLRRKGCIVDIRAKVSEAVELCEQSADFGTGVDIILADVMLDGRPGYALPGELLMRGLKVPVLMMSADGSADMQAKCVQHGAIGFHEKPFEISTVIRAIKQHLYLRFPETHEDTGDFAEAREKLKTSYFAHLQSLLQQLEQGMEFKKVSSILHQVKGSAALYGLTALASDADMLSKDIKKEKTGSLTQAKELFRQSLIRELERNRQREC